MVQLYLNNQLCDLYGSEEIATDYAIAPIANIGSRTGAKSISFKIPLTANNREIIENANVIVNDSTLPYQLIPAQLKANGLDQNLEFAQIKSVGEDINLTLYGSNIDFFSIIKGLKLSDLSDTFEHVWNLANAYASRANTSGYIYGMIDFHSDSPNSYVENSTAQIDVRGLLPSVFLHSIIIQIITEAGFTAQGNFLTNANYKSVIIPCVSKDIGRYKDDLLSTANTTSIEVLDFLAGNIYLNWVSIFDPLTLIASETYTVNFDGVFVPAQTLVRYLIYIGGNYTFKVTGSYSNNSNVFGNRLWLVNQSDAGGFNLIKEVSLTGTSGTFDFTISADCATGDRVHILFPDVAFNSDTIDIASGATFEVTETTVEETIFGKLFDIAANLPKFKQSDLLKDTCQKFGLILQVNNQTKVVSIRQFSEIIDNIPNALDWSDKVDYSEKPEIEFESDYARRNLCLYKADDSVVKPVGTDSEILIDNDNLESEKELFESPFAASEQVLRFGGYSIPQIKYFTDIGTADESTENVEPRYLIKRMEDFSVFTYTDGTSNLTSADVPLTHFILADQTFNAGFENNLLDNSSDLIAMIQNFRLVKMLLRINASDINQLDFFTPVWIEIKGQTGCYFYISEIKQFKVTSKESTEVSLGKLIT